MSAELNGSSATIINCIPHNYGARSRGNWTSCSRRVLNDGSGIITELIFGRTAQNRSLEVCAKPAPSPQNESGRPSGPPKS